MYVHTHVHVNTHACMCMYIYHVHRDAQYVQRTRCASGRGSASFADGRGSGGRARFGVLRGSSLSSPTTEKITCRDIEDSYFSVERNRERQESLQILYSCCRHWNDYPQCLCKSSGGLFLLSTELSTIPHSWALLEYHELAKPLCLAGTPSRFIWPGLQAIFWRAWTSVPSDCERPHARRRPMTQITAHPLTRKTKYL